MAIISNCTASIIKDAALVLKEGHLVAFPTETVYGLGADATNEKAVARIYEAKGRPTDHPLIAYISSMELVDKRVSEIPEYAIKLAREFWPAAMTPWRCAYWSWTRIYVYKKKVDTYFHHQ